MNIERILEIGKATIVRESKALEAVSQSLGSTFTVAVQEIVHLVPGGKVVVSGMGKAGFIAMKISATLASIGIPSFYLHPAEAVHGDLGRFTKNDLSLILSNSGETPEIVRILPHLKLLGCPIICLTAESSSTLAKHSDIALTYGAYQEAEPLGIAPTVSTTIMLALGDALAMAAAEARGISSDTFAQFHPGGSLGRSLTSVDKVMRTGDRHCTVPENMLVSQVLEIMVTTPGRPGAVTILSSDGSLAGILTDGDIRRGVVRGSSFLSAPVSTVMSQRPTTIESTKLVEEALRIMRDHQFDELIVVDSNGKPVGLLDIQDIVAL